MTTSGRLYFSDHGFKRITGINREGEKQIHVGRSGEGPGEFENPSSFWAFGDSYLVYDYNNFKFITYDQYGDLVNEKIIRSNPVNPDQFPPNIPLAVHAISPHELIIPSRERNGSLFTIANIENDELMFVGEAVLPDVVSYSSEEINQAYTRGEIPDILMNLLLLTSSSSGIYSFQQTTGILEKYTRSGDLIWEKNLNIPSQGELFDQIAEHNRNVNMENQGHQLFHYAWALDSNDQGVAILLNMPEGEPVTAAWIPASGNELHLVTFPGLETDGFGLFGMFAVSEDNSRVYFLNNQMGIIYEAEWPV
ncbi:MAG: hypothetical protein JJU13_11930 [Balneolaceae bacterium]|nr:hypothetical protein [Balneolaceae bacterium]